MARSLTVGVLPTTRDKISKYVDVAIVTEMGSARNNICVFSSQVIVACGLGGSGTVSEVALALKAGKGRAAWGDGSRKNFSKISGAGWFRVYKPEDAINVILRRYERSDGDAPHPAQSWGHF